MFRFLFKPLCSSFYISSIITVTPKEKEKEQNFAKKKNDHYNMKTTAKSTNRQPHKHTEQTSKAYYTETHNISGYPDQVIDVIKNPFLRVKTKARETKEVT